MSLVSNGAFSTSMIKGGSPEPPRAPTQTSSFFAHVPSRLQAPVWQHMGAKGRHSMMKPAVSRTVSSSKSICDSFRVANKKIIAPSSVSPINLALSCLQAFVYAI